MTLALLCSGQGPQNPDMFALTGQARESVAVFAAATEALDGTHPCDLLRQGEGAIHANVAGQVLCCTQALAARAALGDTIGREVTLAGYSVGELAAWGCAGILSVEATLTLARHRAEIMDRVGGPEDGLAFVRGLRREAVDALCVRFDCAVAIVNPGDRYVVGGERRNLEAFGEAARQAGASRTGPLAVHVASHTARLASASAEFRTVLDGTTLTPLPSDIRLLSGIDGAWVTDVAEGAQKLAAQIARPVLWAACLEACVEAGVTVFLELGPGRALADMVVGTYPDARARGIDEFRSLDGVRAWLERALA